MLVRVTPQQAVLGMHVEGLEGGWLTHPFWRERFVIKTVDDLIRVRNGGTNLYVDMAKGPGVRTPSTNAASKVPVEPLRSKLTGHSGLSNKRAAARPMKLPKKVVSSPTFSREDRIRAAASAKRSTSIISEVFEDCRHGHPVVMPQIVSVVEDIARALEANSAAFNSVTRLKKSDGYTYAHSIAVCALMITLARDDGASRNEVCNLGIAGMLHDIGKLSIDKAILLKAEALNDDERAQMLRHPETGHAVLAADPNMPDVALDVCLHHHERLDGSGYPFSLTGDQISTAVRIASICDVYDAMTSNRPYNKGKSPIDAITEMEALATTIDQQLLFKFMRSIGVFPRGKLVRLRSNRLAIIMPTTTNNAYPAARAFYNPVEREFLEYCDVILGPDFNDDRAIKAEDPSDWFGDQWATLQHRVLNGNPQQPV